MTLLKYTGFEFNDHIKFLTTWDGGYTTGVTVRTGERAFTAGGGGMFIPLGSGEHATVGLGAGICTQNPGWNTVIRFFEGGAGGTVHVEVRVNTDGSVQAYRGSGGTLLDSEVSGGLVPNVVSHYEIKVVIDDSTGSVEIRKNKSTVLQVSGVDTKNGGSDGLIDTINILSNQAIIVDDVMVWNGAGAEDNDFMGDLRVYPRLITGNGASSDLVGSDGNSTDNFALVDENAVANDSDFVGSSVVDDHDTYALENSPFADGNIISVKQHIRAFKSDAGDIAARRVLRSNGTDYFGSDLLLGTSPDDYIEYFRKDPDTAADWTISGFNSIEPGFAVRA